MRLSNIALFLHWFLLLHSSKIRLTLVIEEEMFCFKEIIPGSFVSQQAPVRKIQLCLQIYCFIISQVMSQNSKVGILTWVYWMVKIAWDRLLASWIWVAAVILWVQKKHWINVHSKMLPNDSSHSKYTKNCLLLD